jgi:hypothetical protein
MEAGYLVVVGERSQFGLVTGATWGRKDIRAKLIALDLAEYSNVKTRIVTDTGREYEGHALIPTDAGKDWVKWFREGQKEPRNKKYNPRQQENP